MMIDRLITILREVLEIVSYSDDREVFVDDFLKMCLAETFLFLAESPRVNKKDIEGAKTYQEATSILLKTYQAEQVENAFSVVAKRSLHSYYTAIAHTLNQERKNEVIKIIGGF